MPINKNIKVVAFDADDTLWINEPYFQQIEDRFCELLEDYLPHHTVKRELLSTELSNLSLYGFGVKGFMLSMIETALRITDKTLHPDIIEKAIELGKELLAKPIELLDGVVSTMDELKQHYRLVVATKGDLLDQERKLKNSGIMHYFHHIEIMSDKKVDDYQKLLRHLDIAPAEFVMIGNSLKSDVLPVLELGAFGIHVPYHTTWAHEVVEHQVAHENFVQVGHIAEILPYLLPETNQ